MDKYDNELQDLLKDYPMPEARAGFYDEALVRAAQQGARRNRNRWLVTGFGSAIAAGIAIWFLSGIFITSPSFQGSYTLIYGRNNHNNGTENVIYLT